MQDTRRVPLPLFSWVLFSLLVLPGWAAQQFVGQVVGISDGDTLSVLRDGQAVKVRLHGVDTPEQRQAFGTAAKQYTAQLAFKQVVTVVVRDTDRYGRLVGEVLLADGRNLNHELVRAGLAWWYRKYAPNDQTLWRLEQEARAAKRGLWSDAQSIAPWAWRTEQRTGSPATAPPPAVTPPPATEAPPSRAPSAGCCRTCRTGKPCGDGCIAANKACTKPSGCACQG